MFKNLGKYGTYGNTSEIIAVVRLPVCCSILVSADKVVQAATGAAAFTDVRLSTANLLSRPRKNHSDIKTESGHDDASSSRSRS